VRRGDDPESAANFRASGEHQLRVRCASLFSNSF
jgi:hypothetical protein